MASERALLGAVAALSLSVLGACGGGLRQFPLQDPLWVDPDRRPFAGEPEEYYSPFAWDGANQLVFRPISRFFAVDPAGRAVNVNAFDEVPDSSWFRNRMGRFRLSAAQVARGACRTPPPDPAGPWTVTGAKPNGANPGFLIKSREGRRYLVKFDGVVQGPRASAADVIGANLYHAAGYYVPCNTIVNFERSILVYDPKAKGENAKGEKEPLSDAHLDAVFDKALHLPDGRCRANLSLFVEGKPIGPWTYEGTRKDDPNDVIPHEDRRELRGMEVLAAWINHFDSREQNTLASFVAAGKGGYVRHYMIDFGDSFGSIWEPPQLGRRIGHAYYLDVGDVVEDFISFGLIRRRWDGVRFGASGAVFGYFDVETFVPDEYKPGYPNPAFVRKQESDAAWMARILARMSDEHVRAAVDAAEMGPRLSAELTRILVGRRDKLLRRYLTRLSPLAWPSVSGGAAPRLCLEDLALTAGVARARERSYRATAYLGDELARGLPLQVRVGGDARPCFDLPTDPRGSVTTPRYMVLDVAARSPDHAPGPLRVHLYYALPKDGLRVVGLERPNGHGPPG